MALNDALDAHMYVRRMRVVTFHASGRNGMPLATREEQEGRARGKVRSGIESDLGGTTIGDLMISTKRLLRSVLVTPDGSPLNKGRETAITSRR